MPMISAVICFALSLRKAEKIVANADIEITRNVCYLAADIKHGYQIVLDPLVILFQIFIDSTKQVISYRGTHGSDAPGSFSKIKSDPNSRNPLLIPILQDP